MLGLLGLVLTAAPARADEEEDELRTEVKTRLGKVEDAIDGWDIVGATRELAELEKLVPESVEAVKYFRGRIAFEEGRYAEALELLQQAGLEDKPGSYLRLAKDTLALTKNHAKAESEHFVFYYPKGKEEVLVPYALETLESIYRAMKEDLGWTPPGGKVRVEVVNNARELSKVSTLTYEQISTTGTIAICKFNKLMVTSPKAVARGYDWQDTLAHEYIHLVVSQASHNEVPIWLHEGLAKFLESRWRGPGGLGLNPSALALLGKRVKANSLVPFEKMSPSIAMLPNAEDAALAFAEVFYAIHYVHETKGTAGFRTIIQELRNGQTDRKAVEAAVGMPFGLFEKAWLAHIKKQPFPKELLPREEVVLKEHAKEDDKEDPKKGREISFGDFMEVQELPARKLAHLGELLRERNRVKAAAAEYAKAYQIVGDKYESVSNKYALTLLELRRLDEAEQVLRGSLRVHPGMPGTNVHLGRIMLFRKDWAKAKAAYMEALSTNPFDPEIHVALTKIHDELGETALKARTKQAGAILTGMTPDAIENASFKFMRDERELSGADVPPPTPEKPAPEAAKDGGK
ncbi:peptidase MA family metallohydrolase [Hyalangium gracile]|uniref:peptidase MA family metallohydrolase n=1 Tax=Hyalangium gracile TaxID=394092 RepID=UPI001CCD3317|nr:tetratricopeptide repeat protein [Hyalangium gracile]